MLYDLSLKFISPTALFTLVFSGLLVIVILYVTWRVSMYKRNYQFSGVSGGPKVLLKLFIVLAIAYIFGLYFLNSIARSFVLSMFMTIMMVLISLSRSRWNGGYNIVLGSIMLAVMLLTFYRLFMDYVPLTYPDSWRDILGPEYVKLLNPYYPLAYLPTLYLIISVVFGLDPLSFMAIMIMCVIITLYVIVKLLCGYIGASNYQFSSLYAFVVTMSISWFYINLLGISSFSIALITSLLTLCIILKARRKNCVQNGSFSFNRKELVLVLVLGAVTLLYHIFIYLLLISFVLLIANFDAKKFVLFVLVALFLVYTIYTEASFVYRTGIFTLAELINLLTQGGIETYPIVVNFNPFTTAVFTYVPMVALLIVPLSHYVVAKEDYTYVARIVFYAVFILALALASAATFPAPGFGRYLSFFSIPMASIFVGVVIEKYALSPSKSGLFAIILLSILFSGGFVYTLNASFTHISENDPTVTLLGIRPSRDATLTLTQSEEHILKDVSQLIGGKSGILADYVVGYYMLSSYLRGYNSTVGAVNYGSFPINLYTLHNQGLSVSIYVVLQDVGLSDIGNKIGKHEFFVFTRPEAQYFNHFYVDSSKGVSGQDRILDCRSLQIIRVGE